MILVHCFTVPEAGDLCCGRVCESCGPCGSEKRKDRNPGAGACCEVYLQSPKPSTSCGGFVFFLIRALEKNPINSRDSRGLRRLPNHVSLRFIRIWKSLVSWNLTGKAIFGLKCEAYLRQLGRHCRSARDVFCLVPAGPPARKCC